MNKALEIPAVQSSVPESRDWIVLLCSIYRGGTSKAIFLRRADLPEDPHLRDAIILTLYGSPDPRQIDGLGGADPLTSKLAIVSPSARPDADVDFTFGQVSLTEAHVDYRGTCGNISSAVGLFAVDQGWVQPVEPKTQVRIWNINSKRLLIAEVPIRHGRSAVTGNSHIAGVPGKGPCVRLDFGDVAGVVTGSLFPTGETQETVWVDGVGNISVSIVDAGSVCVFVQAESVGIPASIAPNKLRNHPKWLSLLETIRGEAACRVGLVANPQDAAQESPAVPKLLMVGPRQAYIDTEGNEVGVEDMDVLGRALTNQQPHQAYPVTGAIATATAAHLPGTLVHTIVRGGTTGPLRIGHPGGVIPIDVSLVKRNQEWCLSHTIVERTARELMRGEAFVPLNRVWALESFARESSD